MTLLAFPFFLGIILHAGLSYDAASHRGERPVGSTSDCGDHANEATAASLRGSLDERGFPQASDWEKAPPLSFCTDWQGNNADTQRETQVRLLWSSRFLYLHFRNHFRELRVFPENNQRRDHLWDRDVAEMFIQPAGFAIKHYREFEISPNGNWIDLDIVPHGGTILMCDLRARASVDNESRIWTGELAIPMNCLTKDFSPGADWRVNFFRAEGTDPERFYSAWRPTGTPLPNFHVPERFGTLRFAPD
jgi:hypothetical protein